MKPDDLRSMAATLDAEGLELAKAGSIVEAAEKFAEADYLREAADLRERALTATSRTGKKRAVEAVERLHVSQGKKEQGSFQQAANAAGYTIRSLAQTLRAEGWRVSHPYLRQCLDGTANIRLSLAERVRDALGKDPKTKAWRWAATRENWPGKAWAKEPDEE